MIDDRNISTLKEWGGLLNSNAGDEKLKELMMEENID